MYPEPAPSPERKPDQSGGPEHFNPSKEISPELQKLRLAQLLKDLKGGTTDYTKLQAANELLNLGEKGVVKARKVISIAALSSTSVREVLWRLIESWSLTHKLPLGPIKRQILAALNTAHAKSVSLQETAKEGNIQKEKLEMQDLEQYRSTNLRMLRTVLNLKGEKALHWLEGLAIGAVFARNESAAFSALSEIAQEKKGFAKKFSEYAAHSIYRVLYHRSFVVDDRPFSDLLEAGAPIIKKLIEPNSRREVQEVDYEPNLVVLLRRLALKSYPMYQEFFKAAAIKDTEKVDDDMLKILLRACHGIFERDLVQLALIGLESDNTVIIDESLSVLKCNQRFLNSSHLLQIGEHLNLRAPTMRIEILRLIGERGRVNQRLESLLLDRLDDEKSIDVSREILRVFRDFGGVRALGELVGMSKNPKYLNLKEEIEDTIISIRQRLQD